MLDWLRGSQDRKEPGHQEFLDSLNSLSLHVENIILEVRDVESNLLDSYPAEGLSMLTRRFESISKNFTDYTIIKRHQYYAIIQKSSSRLTAVKSIAKESKSIAKLFERYAKKPNTFSASTSRLQINRLQGELENLKNACTPDV